MATLKRSPGQPTKYKEDYPQIAYELFKTKGYTLDNLSTHLKVNTDTICRWQNKYPEFYEAIKKGRDELLGFISETNGLFTN